MVTLDFFLNNIYILNLFIHTCRHKHVYLEHNVYHYVDFLIYVKNKKVTDCNGIEKYVKNCLEK
jgi:hypothetical protein